MKKTPIVIEIERKDFPFEVKEIDEDLGIIRGYLSVFDNVDSGKDRVRRGSFKKTITEALQRKNKSDKQILWPLLWFHEPEKPIGSFIDATEDQKGLYVTAQLDISTNKMGYPMNPLATSVFSGFKMGYISQLSIGYKAIQKSYDGQGVRDLTEIQLFEGSAITLGFAMNDLADVTDVKKLQIKKGKPTMTGQVQKKDFNDRYREEQIKDWKGADYQNLTIALQAAIMDIFMIGDTPQDDLMNTLLNGVDNGSSDLGNKIGFIDALKAYVQKGIDLDVANYISDDNQYFGSVSSYGYMSRQDALEGKAGAVVSAANAEKLKGHADTLMQVKDMIGTVADDITKYVTGNAAYAGNGTGKSLEPRNALKTSQPLSTDNKEDYADALAAIFAK